jgi:hypothetical protein
MADLATLLKNFVSTLGGATPTSDDLSTLLTDINAALATALASQGANATDTVLTTPAVTISDSAMTTVVTSPSTPKGTYLALGSVNALLGSTTTYVETQIVEGTATATVQGGTARYAPSAARADNPQIVSVGIVTVTAAGTILLQAQSGTAAATAEYEGSIVSGGVTSLVLIPLSLS